MTTLIFAALLACSETDPAADQAPDAAAPVDAQAERAPVDGAPGPDGQPTQQELSRLTTMDSPLTSDCQEQDDGSSLCAGPSGYSLRKTGEAFSQTLTLLGPDGEELHELSCGDDGTHLFGQQARWRALDGQAFALMLNCTFGEMTDDGFRPAGETIMIRGLGDQAALERDIDARALKLPMQEALRITDAVVDDQ